nr:hypothetical protein [Tanacetum cinerariifolium]
DNPLNLRPPPEPPDDDFDLEPEVISEVMEDIDEPDEGGEIFVSTKIEDVDYFPFMFVIRIFLPYLILPETSPLFLSAESEDTIFDPGARGVEVRLTGDVVSIVPICASSNDNSSIEPNSFNDTSNIFTHPPQPQYETYSCELCGNDSYYGYDCPPRFPLVYEKEPSYNQNYNDNYYPHNSPSFLCCDNCGGPHESFHCQPMNQIYFEPNSNYSGFDQPPQYTMDHQPNEGMSKSNIVFEEINMMFQQLMEILNEENQDKIEEINQVTHTFEPSRRFNYICYDIDDYYDYEESTIPLNEIISQIPPSIVITTSPPVLLIEDPEVSLIMRNEEINTIPKKESDEFTKSSVEDLVPIPSQSEDTFGSDSECLLPTCDDFSPINIFEENLDDVELLLHHGPSTPTMSIVSIIERFTDEQPLAENDVLFDLESKNDEWKKILYDAQIDDLMTEDKVFEPGIHDKKISPTYVSLPFEDRHYLFFTYVVQNFLPRITYPVVSPFLLSSRKEVVARERKRKARTTLLMALPEDHLAKFHKMVDAISVDLDANDKTGLGYDSQMNKSDLNDVHVNESQVIENSLIDSHESDGKDNQVNDRFKKSEGYHAVPPPYTGNYMPPRADLSFVGLDDFVFKFEISKIVTSVNETKTSTSKTSKKSLEKPKTVRPSAPIIEE